MRRSRQLLSALLALFAGHAAAQTWVGNGANDNWSTGFNWSGGVPPASAGTTQVTFGFGASRLSPVVDAPWTINRMSAIGGYSLSGQAITFSGLSPRLDVALNGTGLRVANAIVLAGPMTISNFGFLDLAGGISGTGPVLLTGGPGFTTLAGSSTFTGGLTVGGVHALAFSGSMPGPVTIVNGSGLTGGGSIAGAVTVMDANSWLRPFPGTLHTGSLTVAVSTVFYARINGTSQGTQYGHLDVTGTVTLGAALELEGSFVPRSGDMFTIITNDGTDPVAGTFASLPEGATVMFKGVPLTISYVGGTGNDVTLTAGPIGGVEHAPTLSQWALLLLAMLVFLVGAIQLRRR